jgi:uncharacterized damage-inducible protein DinB
MTADEAKAVAEALTRLWEGEVPATSQVLEAVKDDNREYKPDPKSRTAWQLATHMATSDVWFIDSIASGRFDFDPERAKQAEAQFTTAKSVADFYRKTVPEKLAAFRALPGDTLAETLDFFGIMKMPRAQFIGFANNHSVHHRGQLAAYLRAMGSKVPNIYGPSADAEVAGG